jgi:hypothetical protein
MKHLKNFKNYNSNKECLYPKICEKYGIPNDLKELFEICYKDIENNILGKISTPIILNFNKTLIVESLVIYLHDDTNDGVNGLTTFRKFFNGKLQYPMIDLTFNFLKFDKINIKRVLLHELLHLYEIFKRVSNNVISDIQYKLTNELSILRDMFKNDKFIYNLSLLMYVSTDHEINARVAETYIVLMEDRISDYDIILKNLKKTKSWEKSNDLLNFSNSNLNMYIIDYDNLINFFSLLNTIMCNYSKQKFNLYNIPSNKSDCDKLLKEWKILFKNKAIYMQDKLIKLVDEIVNDVTMVKEAYGDIIYEKFISNPKCIEYETIYDKNLERKSKIFKILRE